MQSVRSSSSYPTSPYPGEIPEGRFVVTNGDVEVGPFSPDSIHSVAASQPVALLTYGSNACPGRLAEKFGDHELSGIAVMPATAAGIDTVWSCNVNSRDAVPRTLAGISGASLDCHVLLLPKALLPRMDRTEGRGGRFYVAARLPSVVVVLDNGLRWEAPITYLGVGSRGPLVDGSGPWLCREHSEQDARALIESGGGNGDNGVLPLHEEIPIDVALSELPSPSAHRFLASTG